MFLADTFVFEIGGSGKIRKRIKSLDAGYIIQDNVEVGSRKEIPLCVDWRVSVPEECPAILPFL